MAAAADALQSDGATVLFVARGTALLGLIAVADPVKAGAPAALAALRAAGSAS